MVENFWDPCLTSLRPWNIFGSVQLCSGHVTRKLPLPLPASTWRSVGMLRDKGVQGEPPYSAVVCECRV